MSLFAVGWALRATSTAQLIDRLVALTALIGSLLLHEFAHAKVGTLCGAPAKSVTLSWFGGQAHFWVEPREDRMAVIALAGPAANFLLAALSFLALGLAFPPTPFTWHDGALLYYDYSNKPGHMQTALRNIAWTNLGLGIFNLLPGLPLDGGHALRSALGNFMGPGRAEWLSLWAGTVIGALLVMLAFWSESLVLLCVAIFLCVVATDQRRRLRYG